MRWWLPSLAGYQRSWLGRDLLAAATLFSIAVPEQLATSRLAGVGAFTALWAFAAASVAFALIGTHRHLSVGADSTIAPLFAAGLVGMAALGGAHYLALAALLALEVGAVLLLVGLFRLGWVADFFSVPIVTGFMAGVAVVIVIHQLPDLLGLGGVTGSTVHRLSVLGGELGHVRLWDLGIGLVVLILVLVLERISARVPGALLALVGSTIMVGAFGLRDTVATLGVVSTAVPHPRFSGLTWAQAGHLVPLAATVALVCLSQSVATIRAFPGGGRDRINRDFVGVGVANLAAGVLGTFPVDASPARTAVVHESQGRTQLVGLLAAAGVLVLVPFSGIVGDIPLAALAGVLIWVAVRLFRYRDLVAIGRFDRWELSLALVTAGIVALIGVQVGIVVALVLAIVDRARLSARPRTAVLGRVAGTTSWAPLGEDDGAAPVGGVVVFLFGAALYFANVSTFIREVHAALASEPAARVLVLDAAAVGDIDFTASRALGRLFDELAAQQVTWALARVNPQVVSNLESSGLLARIGRDRIFVTVDEAVGALVPQSMRPDA